MPGWPQRAPSALFELLLLGCGSSSDAVEPTAGHPAPDSSADKVSYSFAASRRTSEPAACGPFPLSLQLVFEDNLHKVRAVISSQSWTCDLHEDASTYDITCASPRDGGAPVDASLMIVLFEPAPKARIAGEATLTISTSTGSCEHSYALDGKLEY
jgi:hypothetical protein